MKSNESIIAWLDEHEYPHDPHAQTEEQNDHMRQELKICGARNSAHYPCSNGQLENGRCKYHFGNVPRGIAHYRFKDGRRSKYMPKPLLPAFQAALEDPELLSLNEDIATLDALINQEAGRIESGDPSAILEEAKILWQSLWKATQRGDKEAVNRFRARLEAKLEEGASDFSAIGRMLDFMEQKRKAAATEAKRRELMGAVIPIEFASERMRLLGRIVREEVKDRDTLARIAQRWSGAVGQLGYAGADAAPDDIENMA